MPELPDLEIFAKNLKKKVLNKTITSVEVYNIFKVNATTSVLSEKLVGTSIQNIVREGKELCFKLLNNNTFHVHLMLNGKFTVCNTNEIGKINSKIVSVHFEDDQALVVSDFKSLCKVTLNANAANAPDALSKKFTFDYFLQSIKKNARKNIKALLIDQHIIRGIGNAYADEVLWKAELSPESVSGKIPEEYLKALYDAISFVLRDAICNIEKISPDIISGEERSFLQVHNSRKKYTDSGDKILIKKVAAKTTYYTERQKLFI